MSNKRQCLREEIQTGTEEKAGWRWQWRIRFGSARINVCALDRQWAPRQLLAATAWTSPAPGHKTSDMKGWSGRARLVVKGCTPWVKPLFINSFAYLLSFGVSASQWQCGWIRPLACPKSIKVPVRSLTQGTVRSKAAQLARSEDNKGMVA